MSGVNGCAARWKRFEERMDRKLPELKSDLLDKMNEQTKTLFRTFIVSNAAMVLAVATLAFGAARLGLKAPRPGE